MAVKPNKMSEFWKRKVRTFFTLLDYDKDGVMSKDDWIRLESHCVKFHNASKQKEEDFRTKFEKLWQQRVMYAEDKNRLTIEEFVDSMAKQRYNPELIKCEVDMMRGFFSLMDVNSDGYLDEDEHRTIFDQFGVPDTKFTTDTFKAIDTNGDGKLSIEEFITGFFDFLFSEDENGQNTLFFGPLVD